MLLTLSSGTVQTAITIGLSSLICLSYTHLLYGLSSEPVSLASLFGFAFFLPQAYQYMFGDWLSYLNRHKGRPFEEELLGTSIQIKLGFYHHCFLGVLVALCIYTFVT